MLVLHNIRSVHNVGSLFRTADAVGITEIILSGYTPTPTDRFGRMRQDFAKCSLGSEKTVPWEYVKSPNRRISAMRSEGFAVVGVEQDARSVDYKTVRRTPLMAFILGTETTGMSRSLLSLCDQVAEIPMHGGKESLNVSVAGGIVLYRVLDKR